MKKIIGILFFAFTTSSLNFASNSVLETNKIINFQNCENYAIAAANAEVRWLERTTGTLVELEEWDEIYDDYLGTCRAANAAGYEVLMPVFL